MWQKVETLWRSPEVNKALRSDCCVCVWGHQTLELPCSCMEARNARHTVWNHTEEVILSPALQEFGNSGSLFPALLVPGDGVCMAMTSITSPFSPGCVFVNVPECCTSVPCLVGVLSPFPPTSTPLLPTTQRQDRALGFAFRLPCAGLWHEVFLFPFVST